MKFANVRIACWAIAVLLASCPLAMAAPAHATPHPKLVVTTLQGKTFDLAAEHGKWVIVNFWATWCGPCIEEMPAISKYVARHKNVTAIGLAWDQSPRQDVVAFAKKHPVDYPLAQVDTSHPPGGFAAPAALPSTYLVAPDGAVAKHFLGPVDAKLLSAAIDAAAGSHPSTSASSRAH